MWNQALHPSIAPELVEVSVKGPKANVAHKRFQLLMASHRPWVVANGVAIIPARAAAGQTSIMMLLIKYIKKVQFQASKSNSPILKPNTAQTTIGECWGCACSL